ncbi:UDP-xylose transporter 2 [Linum perenne]
MSEGQKFQLGTVGALSLSVVSSVSIVICNKALISTLGFTFATTLTSWHLLVTFCSLHVALMMKLFEHKPFDARAVMGFGILNGISIGLLNLSLGFNSVGFYQFFIVLSCMISVSVNFSTFLVIGKTSPVTYQVLGHLKTCLVLAFGYVLLRDPFSWRNILGILVAIVGMVLYSYFCTLDAQQKAQEPSVKQPEVDEDESDPLINAENGSGNIADSVPAWKSNKDLRV